MASVLENLKKVLFTLFTVGYKQPSANGLVKSDGSVSCIILVASLMGFLFPVLEIFESPFSFETFFILQLSFGCLCLLSSVAWIHLLQCYRKRPHVYLDSLTSVVDPTAKIIYILLLIFTLGIFLHHGLNTILDISCYQIFHEYHHLCSSINRILEILFCTIQSIILIILTQNKFQNSLKVNYVLAIALLTNGILWMFTSLRVAKQKSIYNTNRTSDVIACYYESKIYENVLSPSERIAMQIHLKYFIICTGLTASILPTRLTSKDTVGLKESQHSGINPPNRKRCPDLIAVAFSIVMFIPCLIILILKHWTRPPEYDEVEYLRVWWVTFAIIPNVLLIIATYCGLHRVRDFYIITLKQDYASEGWVFRNDGISILCSVGDISWNILTWHREFTNSFVFGLTFLRLTYIFQVFLQTVFLLILERTSFHSYQKIRNITLCLSVGNAILWLYVEYLVPRDRGFKEIPPELEQIMFSLSTLNRVLSFLRFYRIYSLPE